MATLDTVKAAARISHTKLDDEINRLIKAAQAELIRSGATETVVNAEGSLVTQAIVSYCLMNLTEDINLIDRYRNAFETQEDAIRRSTDVQ